MRRSRAHSYPMVKMLLKIHVCRVLQPEFSLSFTPKSHKRSREATPETCQRTERGNDPLMIDLLPYTVHSRCPILCTGRNHFNRDLQFRGVLQLRELLCQHLGNHKPRTPGMPRWR